MLLFGLLSFKTQALAQGPTLPREYHLGALQSLALFRNESRKELLAALKSISWQEDTLTSVPALLFTSGQSLDPEGRRVLNRVQLFSDQRFDLWLMKQRVAGRGNEMRDWNRIVIAVDRHVRPFRSYYFQFGREAPGEKGLPPFKAFTAACLTCHSSGPRLIRPEPTQWTASLSRQELSLMKKWNWKIMGYREVLDHRPRWKGHSMLEWDRPGDHDQLQVKACTQCHFRGSGVRSPLYRQNAESILYLTRNTQGHAEMPIEDPPLTLGELKRLNSWLEMRTK